MTDIGGRNQRAADDELSAEELDEVAGGETTIILNGVKDCGGDVNNVAGCGANLQSTT